MTRIRLLPRLIGIGIIVLIVGFAGFGFNSFRKDLETLREVSQENILWSAAQLEIELLRFQQALAEVGYADDAETLQRAHDRFDIVWSRVALFQQGQVGRRLAAYDAESRAVERLFERIQEIEPALDALTPGDRDGVKAITAALNGFQQELRLLTRRVIVGEELRAATFRDRLRASAQRTVLLSLAAVTALALGLILVSLESRRFQRLAAANRALADMAERANAAKSRFLTMISHELRTPMNGVLGLLALARQTDLSQSQQRLLEQAERSGNSMMRMLSDLLDYSEMQDSKLQLVHRPFSPRALAQAIEAEFLPVARRAGTAFRVEADPELPNNLTGDTERLRQIFTHLADYVLQTAGSDDIVLRIAHRDGMLSGTLTFGYGGGTGDWTLDLVTGDGDRDPSQFATDALGPAIARGLLDLMGGRLRVTVPGGGKLTIEAAVPAEPFVFTRMLVHLDVRSVALQAIYEAALTGDRLRFHSDEPDHLVQMVMVEAGADREASRIAALRARFPGALFVSLGVPRDRTLFDDVIEAPFDVAGLRQALLSRL